MFQSIAVFFLVSLLIAFAWWRRRARSLEGGELDEAVSSPPAEIRAALSALLCGGLLLVVLAQVTAAAMRPHSPPSLHLLLGLGAGLFLLGGHGVAGGHSSIWRRRPVRWLREKFELGPGQLVLLTLAPCFAYLARLAAGNELLARHAAAATLAWLLSIFAAVAGSYRRDRPAAWPGRREGLLVILLFLAGFLLRVLFLEMLPATLSGDEASAGLVAAEFQSGRADNLLGLGWFSFPSLYFALQSGGLWLFGQTTLALRASSALAGALTVVAVYWLARSLFGRLAGLLASLFLLGFHFHVHFSRIGLQNIWDGLFLVVVLGGVWHGWQSGRRSSFLLAGVALGLGQYFYVSMRVVPLLILAWAGVALVVQRERFFKRLPHLILAAFVAATIFLPLGLLFLERPAEFNAPMARVTVFGDWLENEMQQRGLSAGRIILEQMALVALGFTHEPLRHWYNPGVPLLLAVPAGLFLTGLLWLIYEFSLRSLLLLLPLVALVVLGGLSQDAPASQRFVLVAPIVAAVVALPLALAAGWLRTLWPQWRRVAALAAILIMGVVTAGDVHYYFFEVYDSYVLGGFNTETATAIARYLQESEEQRTVYFFGPPRMGYRSLSTIPYLAPEMHGEDVMAPLTSVPQWSLSGPTTFIFLPERQDELELVAEAYPGGRRLTVTDRRRRPPQPLFVAYEVNRTAR